MAEKQVFKNRIVDGVPVDRDGDQIIDLRQRIEVYVTAKHPRAKAHGGVGAKILMSAHTHGPAALEKGWVQTEPIDAEQGEQGATAPAKKAAKKK